MLPAIDYLSTVTPYNRYFCFIIILEKHRCKVYSLDDTFGFGKFYNYTVISLYADGRIPPREFKEYLSDVLKSTFSKDFDFEVTKDEIVFNSEEVKPAEFKKIFNYLVSEAKHPTDYRSKLFYAQLQGCVVAGEKGFGSKETGLTFLDKRRAMPKYVEWCIGKSYAKYFYDELNNSVSKKFCFSPEDFQTLEDTEIREPKGVTFHLEQGKSKRRTIKYSAVYTYRKHKFSGVSRALNDMAFEDDVQERKEMDIAYKKFGQAMENLNKRQREESLDAWDALDRYNANTL